MLSGRFVANLPVVCLVEEVVWAPESEQEAALELEWAQEVVWVSELVPKLVLELAPMWELELVPKLALALLVQPLGVRLYQ